MHLQLETSNCSCCSFRIINQCYPHVIRWHVQPSEKFNEKVYKEKAVFFHENGDFHAKEDLLKIDVLKAKNHKPLNLIDIGMKPKLFFSDLSLIEDERCNKFRTECLNF